MRKGTAFAHVVEFHVPDWRHGDRYLLLASHTGIPLFRWASAVGYVVSFFASSPVFVRTTHATSRGTLLRAPAPGSTTLMASKDVYPGVRAGG